MSSYGVFADYYDSLTNNVDYKKYSEYILELLEENGVREGILLDLACGTGSISIHLAKAGYDVIGVDGSYEMLSKASEKAYNENLSILFLCQKMQDLDLYGTIDGAVCTLDSINHVTDYGDVSKIFARVSLFLNPNGIFIFDLNTVYKHSTVLANNTFVYDHDDVYCVWQNEYIEKDNIVNINLDFFIRDGNVYTRNNEFFSERAYEFEEISGLLHENGFELLSMYAENSHSLPNEETQRIVYVVRKVL